MKSTSLVIFGWFGGAKCHQEALLFELVQQDAELKKRKLYQWKDLEKSFQVVFLDSLGASWIKSYSKLSENNF